MLDKACVAVLKTVNFVALKHALKKKPQASDNFYYSLTKVFWAFSVTAWVHLSLPKIGLQWHAGTLAWCISS